MTDRTPAHKAGALLADLHSMDAQLQPRPVQIRLAEAVEATMADQAILLAEAGTGTGKSLAYLLPALLSHRPPLVVSTATRQLQDQLVDKELPRISSIIAQADPDRPPLLFTVMFGRGNYLSRRRLQAFARRHPGTDLTETLVRWSETSQDGILDEIAHLLDNDTREQIESQSDNCQGGRCPFYQACFYFRHRRLAARSDVIVVNHALLLTDARLRGHGARLLPDYPTLIVDEAHALHRFAVSLFGTRFHAGPVQRQLTRLLDRPRRPGLLQRLRKIELLYELLVDEDTGRSIRQLLGEIPPFAHDLEIALTRWQLALLDRLKSRDAFRLREGDEQLPPVRDCCDALFAAWFPVKKLLVQLDDLIEPLREAEPHPASDDLHELHSRTQRLVALFSELDQIVWQLRDDQVHMLTKERNRPILEALPIDPGPLIEERVWRFQESAILVSATLRSGDSFNHIRSEIGLTAGSHEGDRTRELALAGGINWHEQAQILVADNAPSPGMPKAADYQAERILQCAAVTAGRTLVLLTSWQQLRGLKERLATKLSRIGLQLYAQGDMSRSELLRAFQSTPSVLLGLDSFWEGVDIPGPDLVHVIIGRLPFPVPTEPWNEAVQAWLSERGQDPFSRFMLPRAILRLRQGVGRLLRSTTDRGVVTILDPRIARKSYGRIISASLPGQWLPLPSSSDALAQVFVDLNVATPHQLK